MSTRRARAAGELVGRFLIVLALVAGTGPGAPLARGAEPGAPAPSCADRYPVDGPAGLDLRLGCIVGELVGHFTGSGASRDPAPISTYLGPLLLLGGGVSAVVIVAWLLRRRLGRRMVPVTPASWWSCPACRSVNAEGTTHCYKCGAPFESSAQRLNAP